MQKRKARKQSVQTTLTTLRTVMAKPRRVESSKKNADTLANGGHMAVRAAQRIASQASTRLRGGHLRPIPHC